MLKKPITDKNYQFHFTHLSPKAQQKTFFNKPKMPSPKVQFKNSSSHQLLATQYQTPKKNLLSEISADKSSNPENYKLGSPGKLLISRSKDKAKKLQGCRYKTRIQRNKMQSLNIRELKEPKPTILDDEFVLQLTDQQILKIGIKLKQVHHNNKRQFTELSSVNQIQVIKERFSVFNDRQAQSLQQILALLKIADSKIINQGKVKADLSKNMEKLQGENQQLQKKIKQMKEIHMIQQIKNSEGYEDINTPKSNKTDLTDSSFEKQLRACGSDIYAHSYEEQYKKILSLFSIDLTQEFHNEKVIESITKIIQNLQDKCKDLLILKEKERQFHHIRKVLREMQKQCNLLKSANFSLHQELEKHIYLTQELSQELLKTQMKLLNSKYPKPHFI